MRLDSTHSTRLRPSHRTMNILSNIYPLELTPQHRKSANPKMTFDSQLSVRSLRLTMLVPVGNSRQQRWQRWKTDILRQ